MRLNSLLLLVAACATAQTPPSAPAQQPARDFGVIVMAHGGSPEWNRAVEDTVAPLRDRYEIEVAFGMADATSLQEAVRKLEARHVRRIGVVRMFVSGESWLERTEQIFGLRPGAPPPAEHREHAVSQREPRARPDHVGGHHDAHLVGSKAAAGAHHHSMAFFRVASRASFELSRDGLADEPAMSRILADRARTLSVDPAREDILVLAHGPGDDAENDRWLAKLDARAAAIRELAPFRRVQVETLREDWPEKRAAAEQRIRTFVARATAEGGTAIVIPFRVQGFGPYATVLEGLQYRSDGQGLIPHAEVAVWIERQIRVLDEF
jgi:sirohydrochlorin cobaltochelatase